MIPEQAQRERRPHVGAHEVHPGQVWPDHPQRVPQPRLDGAVEVLAVRQDPPARVVAGGRVDRVRRDEALGDAREPGGLPRSEPLFELVDAQHDGDPGLAVPLLDEVGEGGGVRGRWVTQAAAERADHVLGGVPCPRHRSRRSPGPAP
jgi:hypothetical protein